MTAIHVVVRPRPARSPAPDLLPGFGLFDVVVDGVNLTARIGDAQAQTVLADFGHALSDLVTGQRRRAVVQLYSDAEPWELGLEVDGPDVLVCVYRAGSAPELAVHERRVELVALVRGVAEAIGNVDRTDLPPAVSASMDASIKVLESARVTGSVRRQTTQVSVAPRGARGLALSAQASVRVEPEGENDQGQVERSDLHALLFVGSFAVTARGKTAKIDPVPLFLVAERLVELSDEVLRSAQAARLVYRRCQVGQVRLGVRLTPSDRKVALTVGSTRRTVSEGLTFPQLLPSALAETSARFARSLCEAVLSADPSQNQNLRLTALQSEAAALLDRARSPSAELELTNPRPDDYRPFATLRRPPSSAGTWAEGGQMRFMARWMATVPHLDLQSVFLSGPRVIVGTDREIVSLHKNSGEVEWRQAVPRAGTLVTPSSLVRIHPDGRIGLFDLESGRHKASLRLVPRADGGASGAVVHCPGLPKLLALAEGDRRVTAVDLMSGEIRWRFTANRPAAVRVRRAGKLLLVAGGDSVLVALDVATGELVWRARAALPFSGEMVVDNDDAFALTAAAQSGGHLYCYDAWSGALRFTAAIAERPILGQLPLVTRSAVVVPIRSPRGVGARAFARGTGEPLWQLEPGFFPKNSAWIAVDDCIVVNTASGTLTALDAATGAFRFNHAFAGGLEADQPRRLEPVLREGALFVPQHQVHVVRPRDGAVIGTVPTDLIADVLRVDTDCSVVVAEESGHVAAFGAGPRLVRVK